MDRDAWRRQLLEHVQSWRGAGIEWFPPAPTLTLATPADPVNPPSSTTLFPRVDESAPATALPTLEERRQGLKILAEEVRRCVKCPELASTRSQTVFADGDAGVDLCFVGEAPGADEDAQGLPFVGAAGQLLNKIIAACGLGRREVYICNIIKCRPPGNRTPLPNECANCRDFLERQINLVKPKYICALGGCAATNLLQTTQSLGKLRGKFHDFLGIPVMVTYHPAFLLPHRQPEKKREVWADMQWLMRQMGRTIPGK